MTLTKDRVRKLDRNLRHKSDTTAAQFIEEYCKLLRDHAYATADGSLNEMEKTLTHVVGMLIYYQRFTEIMGFSTGVDGFDPRDFVNEFEQYEQDTRTGVEESAAEQLSAVLPGYQLKESL